MMNQKITEEITKIFHLILFFTFFIFLFSCQKPQVRQAVDSSNFQDQQRQLMIYAENKEKQEQAQIQQYLKQQKETFKTDGGGFWYTILKKPKDAFVYAKEGDKVLYTYSVMDLSGEILYDFDAIGFKTHKIDQQASLRVLEMALKTMPLGSESKLVSSSFAAYGTRGDGKIIMPYEPLIFHLKILDIKK